MAWSADVGRWGMPLDQPMASHGLAGAEMALEHIDHVRPHRRAIYRSGVVTKIEPARSYDLSAEP
jgi:hypothetical protein